MIREQIVSTDKFIKRDLQSGILFSRVPDAENKLPSLNSTAIPKTPSISF